MMVAGRLFILFLLLAAGFIFSDFPGIKIVTYMVIVVAVLSNIYKKIAEKSFDIERMTDTYKVFAGIPEPNVIIISNKAPIPIHGMVITDTIDSNISLEPKQSFFVSIVPHGEKSFAYPITGRKRGKYKIGPTLVSFTDLMGLYRFEYEVDTARDVIVFPNIKKIVNVPYKSLQPLGIIKNKVPIFEDQTMITGLKTYQYGDEIKKINWKVSAKHNKFMVNTYQPSISAASMIILNLYDNDFNFKSKEFYVENGIEAAASLLREFFTMKQEVAFTSNCRIDDADNVLSTNTGKGEAHFTSILTNMAVMQPSKQISFNQLIEGSRIKLSWGMSLYVFTPKLDEQALYRLIDFRNSGHNVVLVNIGPDIHSEMSLWNIGIQSFYSDQQEGIINLTRI